MLEEGSGMKPTISKVKVCPLCGRTYTDHPALSRIDSETLICSDCGTRQALESIGVADAEQDKILHTIHRFSADLQPE